MVITKSQKEVIEKSNEIISRLYNTPVIQAYEQFIKLTQEQKISLYRAWDNYYADCARSPESELMREAKSALFANNMPRVKELASQAREMLVNDDFVKIPQPSLYDPVMLYKNADVVAYLKAKEELAKTRKGIETLF